MWKASGLYQLGRKDSGADGGCMRTGVVEHGSFLLCFVLDIPSVTSVLQTPWKLVLNGLWQQCIARKRPDLRTTHCHFGKSKLVSQGSDSRGTLTLTACVQLFQQEVEYFSPSPCDG